MAGPLTASRKAQMCPEQDGSALATAPQASLAELHQRVTLVFASIGSLLSRDPRSTAPLTHLQLARSDFDAGHNCEGRQGGATVEAQALLHLPLARLALPLWHHFLAPLAALVHVLQLGGAELPGLHLWGSRQVINSCTCHRESSPHNPSIS